MSKRKLVAFDIDTKKLKEFYPKRQWQNAYKEIKKHMEFNSFQWREGSLYISKEPISLPNTTKIIESLGDTQPWLKTCIRDCVISNVSRSYSLNHLFEESPEIHKEIIRLKQKYEEAYLLRKTKEEEEENSL